MWLEVAGTDSMGECPTGEQEPRVRGQRPAHSLDLPLLDTYLHFRPITWPLVFSVSLFFSPHVDLVG